MCGSIIETTRFPFLPSGKLEKGFLLLGTRSDKIFIFLKYKLVENGLLEIKIKVLSNKECTKFKLKRDTCPKLNLYKLIIPLIFF
jgi:hypothetical protein